MSVGRRKKVKMKNKGDDKKEDEEFRQTKATLEIIKKII